MPPPSSEIDEHARRRVAADEARLDAPDPGTPAAGRTTGARSRSQSLTDAGRQFWAHPSPWLLGGLIVGALGYRASLPTAAWAELIAPVALVVLFPVIEWVIHVAILHWRPRKVAGVALDTLLSRKHRAHHADPRILPLVFIPWQVELWLLPAYVGIAVLVFPGVVGATLLLSVGVLMFTYEWVHFLVHSDYRPRTRAFRAVWRNHRLHHYKNEHYWFTVTTSGTADRLFGTCPEAGTVPTSPTVRRLHALEAGQPSADPAL